MTLFAASVLILFAVVAWSASRFMSQQLEATVSNEIAEVEANARADGATLRQVVERLAARSPGIYYLLLDRDGRMLAGNIAPTAPVVGPRILPHVLPARAGHGAEGLRGQGAVLADGMYLFVGISDFELVEMQEVISRAFLLGSGATLLLAVAGGVAMSLGVQRRVEAISRTSREIMAGDLAQRIAIKGTGDEFDHLAASQNAMLDRIQDLVRGLQQVSSDIAHDLRTPLTRLRQRLEMARQRDSDIAGLQAALDGAIGDADAILQTFAALLRIAQIEAGARRSGFVRVDLGRLLYELVEAYHPVAEGNGQTLSWQISPDLWIKGDRDLLTQLFANLIENAIRHTLPGAEIIVTAWTVDGCVHIAVSDNGPGIPAESRTLVLDRFYRLDRSRTTPGSGLGLSLVDAVVHLHEGRLSLEDNEPGLRCVVSIAFPP